MNERDNPPLDRWRADEVLGGAKPENIWGAEPIAAAMGVSVATVYRWTADPTCNVPISRPRGRYFARRSELLAWLRAA